MFEFEPAKNRRNDLGNATLQPVERLVLGMRWFVGRAGVVLAVNSHYKILQTERERIPSRLNHSIVTIAVLELCYWETLIVNLRAMLETKLDSLGIGPIAALLEPGAARDEFCGMLEKTARRKVLDAADRDAYLDYIQRYSKILSTRKFPVPLNAHPLIEKTELVRRAASKRVTHASVDAYALYGSDLQDLVLAVLVLAEAMDQVMGEAGSEELLPIEHAALVGGAQLLQVDTDTVPHTLNTIRGFLPMWVHSDHEFPSMADMEAERVARRARALP